MNTTCILCFEDKQQKADLFNTLFPHPYLCCSCVKKLQKNKRKIKILNTKVRCIWVYDDFFENLIFQYKENQDTLLRMLLLPSIHRMLKKYKNIPIVIAPSKSRNAFHPLKYLLQDYTIIEAFYKQKHYKQSNQNKQHRHLVHQVIKRNDTPLPECVILFDDVVTSGNTLACCIQLLQNEKIKVIPIVLSLHQHYQSYELKSHLSLGDK